MKPSIQAILLRLQRAALVDMRVANALGESCNNRVWLMGEWHLNSALRTYDTVRAIRTRFPNVEN